MFRDSRICCNICKLYHHDVYHICFENRSLEGYPFFTLLKYYLFTKQRPEFYLECKKELKLRINTTRKRLITPGEPVDLNYKSLIMIPRILRRSL